MLGALCLGSHGLPRLRFKPLLLRSPLDACWHQDVLCWACVLLWLCCVCDSVVGVDVLV